MSEREKHEMSRENWYQHEPDWGWLNSVAESVGWRMLVEMNLFSFIALESHSGGESQ